MSSGRHKPSRHRASSGSRAGLSLRLVCVWFCLAFATTAKAQDVRRDSFEEGPKSGRELGSDTQYRVLDHQRYQGDAHSGQSFELWHITASNGSFVHVGYPVPHARVIEELSFSIWAKSERGGPSLLVRVVLPRTIDPRTGEPARVLIQGTSYRDPGRWQELRVAELNQEVTRAAQRLRLEISADVDDREAYVDQVIVNIYAGAGETSLALDDLEVRGLVERKNERPTWGDGNADSAFQTANVRRSGTQLLVNGQPFFPRAIQYRGESMQTLRQLGFNALHVDKPASRELLIEASQHGLWVISPPPFVNSVQGKPQLPVTFEPHWRGVLVWDLGLDLQPGDHQAALDIAEDLRERTGRPVLCSASSGLRELARHVDIFCPSRRPLESTLDLNDYATWLREQPRLTRPGIPRWTIIQTEPTLANLQQQSGLAGQPIPERAVDFDALRLVVYNALASGIRGIIFSSRQPLDDGSNSARLRGMMLELLNLELELIQPWLAAGNVTAIVNGNQPDISAAILRTDRARLLLPMWTGSGAQFVPGQAAAHGIAITAPGVPETDEAYEIMPGGKFRVRRRRVAGGVLITLDEFDLTSQILLTQDARIVAYVSQRLAEITHRAVILRRELLEARLRDTEVWNRRMAQAGLVHPSAEIRLAESREALARCNAALAAGDDGSAYTFALRAARPLRLLEHAQFEKYAGGKQQHFLSSPLSMSTRTLPEMAEFARRMSGSRWNLNMLPGGDCENLDRMVQAGWAHQQQELEAISSAAGLAYGGAHTGAYSMRLRVAPNDPNALHRFVETAPLWISTPPVPVRNGDIVKIRGWVKVPAPIVGSVDGLAIADNLGGPELMLRIGGTEGWQEFVIYRHAEKNTPLRVTFALFGYGEAFLDDITIETLTQGMATQGPQGMRNSRVVPLPAPPGGIPRR